jgi:hypothetical protein
MNTITRFHRRHFPICIVLALLLTGSSAGQPEVRVSHIPIDQLTMGDINFQAGVDTRHFFSVSISGIGGIQPVLQIHIDVQLPGQSRIDLLRCFSSGTLPPTFSNLDIGTRVEINCARLHQQILDAALATGKLPAGTYTFVFSLLQGDTVIAHDQFSLDIRNISRLDLLSPRDGEEVSTTFPLFQWMFDGSQVELSVYERLPQHSSKEEAAQGVPHLCVVLENVRSFQYPSSTPPQACPGVVVRNLEAGKRYVWRVRGLTVGTGGVGASLDSEIWEFTVPSGAGQTMQVGGDRPQSLSNQIQSIPGLDPQLLSRLISGNLQPTGVVLIDGVPVSLSEIMAILNDLASNPDRIINIQVVER